MDKRNTIGMLVVNICFVVIQLFVQVFLVAEIFVLSGESITAVAWFTLLELGVLFLFYTIASAVCKVIKPIWVNRFAAVLGLAFVLLVIFWQDGLYSHFMLLGVIWGTVLGLYWGAMNFLIAQVFNRKTMFSYMVWSMTLTTVARMLFPFSFGFIIDFGSFLLTSIIVLGITVIQLVGTFLIKPPARYVQPASRSLRFRAYFRALKHANFLRPALKFFVLDMLFSFHFGIALSVTIMIMLVFGTSLSLGIFGSVFAVTSIIFLVAYKKLKLKHFWVAGVLPVFATAALFIDINVAAIIVFQAVFLSLDAIVRAEEGTLRMNATKYWGGEEFIVESHLFYEFALFVGRMILCAVILVVGILGGSPMLFAGMVALFVIMFAISAIGMYLWKKRYVTQTVVSSQGSATQSPAQPCHSASANNSTHVATLPTPDDCPPH